MMVPAWTETCRSNCRNFILIFLWFYKNVRQLEQSKVLWYYWCTVQTWRLDIPIIFHSQLVSNCLECQLIIATTGLWHFVLYLVSHFRSVDFNDFCDFETRLENIYFWRNLSYFLAPYIVMFNLIWKLYVFILCRENQEKMKVRNK
jgi:hypothetical protein